MNDESPNGSTQNDDDPFGGWDPDKQSEVLPKETRDMLKATGQRFDVLGMQVFDTQYGKRAFVSIMLDDGTEGTYPFAADESVPSRDRVLRNIWHWQRRNPGKTFRAWLYCAGKTVLLVPDHWTPKKAIEKEEANA